MASSSGGKKAVKKLMRDLKKAGYQLYEKGGHGRIWDPVAKKKVGQFSMSPHSEEAVKKMRAELKRDGVRGV